jgi:hypothetical protein
MHRLVELHGQSEWVAALTPPWMSVDGTIVAALLSGLYSACSGKIRRLLLGG